MTIEEITAKIAIKQSDWAREHQADLERISTDPEIAASIRNLIEKAARHPKAVTGDPRTAVRKTLALCALANFRLGLLVGTLLYKPPAPPPAPPETEPGVTE